jgi:DNA-binding HxlR family transcriptional regulator
MKKKLTPSALVCADDCPVRKTAAIIDGKWITLIIRDLLSGKKRYSELLRSLTGVSPKILAARLKFLEEKNIISKKTYPTVPPKTEYTLTAVGMRLKNVVIAMEAFGKKLP